MAELAKRAASRGVKDGYLNSLRSIDYRLKNEARDFGEPLNKLAQAKLTIRHGIQSPTVVYWAVHDEKPVVFVKDFLLLPGSIAD
ncbi:MAG: hypothetical protein L0215_24820 [Gemmataceae bacterium]|nr:hypothetical protein [Gemmataceae bacterium]